MLVHVSALQLMLPLHDSSLPHVTTAVLPATLTPCLHASPLPQRTVVVPVLFAWTRLPLHEDGCEHSMLHDAPASQVAPCLHESWLVQIVEHDSLVHVMTLPAQDPGPMHFVSQREVAVQATPCRHA